MTAKIEKSKNFRIDALLAHGVEQRTDNNGASPGLFYSGSPDESPASTRGSESPSLHSNPSLAPPGVLSKSHLFNLSQSGFAALHQVGLIGVHPGSIYPLAALGGQHPAFMCTGFGQLVQPYTEQMKGGSMASSLPPEAWIRAGMMMPRLEYGGVYF